MEPPTGLTDRQQREIEYHKEHAKLVSGKLGRLNTDVLYCEKRRWWNAYWDIFTYLKDTQLAGKKTLVVGCGAGEDAVRLSKLGADVHAFDLSQEMLNVASQLADDENATVHFSLMSAERLDYPDETFDIIFARDIFHHVDIPTSLTELQRVAKKGCVVIVNEIYSHSITDLVRRSTFVEKVLYPKMTSFVYGGTKPYITQDERKLSETDVKLIMTVIGEVSRKKYFNFIVTRLISDRYDTLNKIDRLVLTGLGPLARFVAGRIILVGVISKVAGQRRSL